MPTAVRQTRKRAVNDEALARRIKEQPHILGHYLGYDRLKDIHGDWIKRVWQSPVDLTLQAHRNSYKTTAVLIVGSMWYLIFNPDNRVLLCRKTYTNACSILQAISEHYKRAEMKALYQKLYGIDDLKLFRDRQDRLNLPTKGRSTPEGNIDAAGIDSSVTGNHYERIHTDDIITKEDRISGAHRKRTDAFVDELRNVLVPGGVQTNTGTPWHKDDSFRKMPKPIKHPVGTLPIDGFTPEYIQELRNSMSASLFACNYELNHIVDGDRIFG